jgi:uncharacterized protein
MEAGQIAGFVASLIVMLAGIAGCVLPGLPGAPLVLLAAMIHKLVFGPTGAAWWVLVLMTVLMALSLALDYLATLYGAKKLGATWRGAVGAMLGVIAGMFFLPLGLLIGPFVGAFLLELTGPHNLKGASKAGLGATLGVVIGMAGKVAAAVTMTLLWTGNVLYRSLQ